MKKDIQDYEVLTKEGFIKYNLCKIPDYELKEKTIKELNAAWDKVRKGYEFAILAGENIFSVDCFNEKILKGSNKKKDKEEAMTVTVGLNKEDFEEMTSKIEEMVRLEKSLNQLKNNLGYVILTREQYATNNFTKTGDSFIGDRKILQFKTISDEEWERISGGKNFVVMVNGEVCSLDFFEKNILGIDE